VTGAPGLSTTALPVSFVPTVLGWSSDGRYLAVGGSTTWLPLGTNGLAVVDVQSGQPTWHLEGPDCLDLVVSGSMLIAVVNGALSGYDLETGEPRWSVPALSGLLGTDPNRHLVAVTANGTTTLVRVDTGAETLRVSPTVPAVRQRAILSPSGRQFVLMTSARLVILDTLSGSLIHDVPMPNGAVLGAAFDETGDTLTIVDKRASVRVLDIGTAATLRQTQLEGVSSIFVGFVRLGDPVAISPGRDVVLITTLDGLSMHSAASGRRLANAATGGGSFTASVYASPDARAFVAVRTTFPNTSEDPPPDAKLFNSPGGDLLWQQAETEVTAGAFSRQGRLAVARHAPGGAGGVIDLVTAGEIGHVSPLATTRLSRVAVAATGVRLVAGTYADDPGSVGAAGTAVARVHAVETGQLLLERAHPGVLTDLAFVDGGQGVVTAASDRDGLRLFDTVSGLKRWMLAGVGSVNAVAVVTGSHAVVSVGADRTVRCVGTNDGAVRWQVTLPQAGTRVVASPDGRFVVVACGDRTARRLDVADGTQRWQVQHDQRVSALAISADSTLVASASADAFVFVTLAADGSVGAQISHIRAATAVVFTTDGAHVVSGSVDGAVTLSPVDGVGPGTVLASFGAAVVRLAVSGNDAAVAVGTQDGRVTVLGLGPETPVELARFFTDDGLSDVAIDGAARTLAIASAGGQIRVVDWPAP
jgi:WD40 repeat protein